MRVAKRVESELSDGGKKVREATREATREKVRESTKRRVREETRKESG